MKAIFKPTPAKYRKAFKRSIYFPEGTGHILSMAEEMGERLYNKGVNEIVKDALSEYVKNNFMFYWKKRFDDEQP
jgi:hypothetical protein